MRQAYDYWQDQPDNCSLRRSSTSAKALEDCCPPGPRSSIGVDRRQSVKTLSTTRSRRHWTIFQSVNVNSDSVVSCSHTESGTNLPKLDRDFSLRSQHLRPPELLSSPVKLSLFRPCSTYRGTAEKEVGARAYFNKYYKYYKTQFAISLLPQKIQKIRKVNLTDNAQQNTLKQTQQQHHFWL